ncbi:hypothetical protein [Streptomyces sp. NPDC092307]|uniref:hypothetical protein n=1 Tax=Streptomyces sp. NPDC092307 TaxID=3366013 RepID=UPI00380D7A3E
MGKTDLVTADHSELPFNVPSEVSIGRIAQAAAGCGLVLGTAALAGWAMEGSVLGGLLHRHVPMEISTAACLVLLGTSVLLSRRRARFIHGAAWCAALVASIALATLIKYATGVPGGTQQAAFTHSAATASVGGMAAGTALALLFTGLAQTLQTSRRQRVVALGQALSVVVVVQGLTRIYSVIFEVPGPGHIGGTAGRPALVGTAVSLLLMGGVSFLTHPTVGLAGLLANSGTTGLLGRWILTTVTLVPPVLSWLLLAGQDAGFYGRAEIPALLVGAHAGLFGVICFVTLGVSRAMELAGSPLFPAPPSHVRAPWPSTTIRSPARPVCARLRKNRTVPRRGCGPGHG